MKRFIVGLLALSLAAFGGQAAMRLQAFVPVSNAVTGATSAFGAPSLRCCARKDRKSVV